MNISPHTAASNHGAAPLGRDIGRDILRPSVLIIGGGAVGAGILRDLALRGVRCLLAEKKDVNAGASGGNHGLLHSGARYVLDDPEAARECASEGALLKRLAPQCVEDTGGIFAAVPGDDEAYIARFPELCRRAGVACAPLSAAEALELEPALSPDIIAAFRVADASIDPFKLSLENIAQAKDLTDSVLARGLRVTRFVVEDGRIVRVRCMDETSGQEIMVEPEQVVNAAGAWAGKVAALAGASVPMLFSSGALLVTNERLANRVLNRLRPPGDGDILVPGGTVSILGTTSRRIEDPDLCRPTTAEIDRNIEEGGRLVPLLREVRYIRAYSGVRPLLAGRDLSLNGSEADEDDRSQGRGFALFDHEAEGLSNFVTITGGKLTTFRLMAEKASDLVAQRLGITAPCRTASDPLPEAAVCEWTEPGRASRRYTAHSDQDSPVLCECEMVSADAIDAILDSCRDSLPDPGLLALSTRSRVGKGACQGAFCAMRIMAHLHDAGVVDSGRGLHDLRAFLAERYKGQRPILWEAQMRQFELAEALHCGLLGLELPEIGGES